jgi:hypothetical protein
MYPPTPARRVLVRLATLAACTLLTTSLRAQEPVPVASLLRDADGNRAGRTVTISGTITAAPGAVERGERTAVLQDSTGGMLLATRDSVLLPGDLAVGERVEVRGRLRMRHGGGRLAVTKLRRLGSGVVPEPVPVLARELAAGSYQGQLVRIVGELVIPADIMKSHAGLVVKDHSGTVPVRTPARFFENRAFVRGLVASRAVELVGVAGRSEAGYELAARQPEDFVLVTAPSYAPFAAGALVLALLALTFHFWLQRRRARSGRARWRSSRRTCATRAKPCARARSATPWPPTAPTTACGTGTCCATPSTSPALEADAGVRAPRDRHRLAGVAGPRAPRRHRGAARRDRRAHGGAQLAPGERAPRPPPQRRVPLDADARPGRAQRVGDGVPHRRLADRHPRAQDGGEADPARGRARHPHRASPTAPSCWT